MSYLRQPCHVCKLKIIMTNVTRHHWRYAQPLPHLIPKRTENIAIQKQMICRFLMTTTWGTNRIFWLNHTPVHQGVFSRQAFLKEAPCKQGHFGGNLLVPHIYNKTPVQRLACSSDKCVGALNRISARGVQ